MIDYVAVYVLVASSAFTHVSRRATSRRGVDTVAGGCFVEWWPPSVEISEERERVITIKLMNVLVRHSAGGRAEFSAEARIGLRVRDVVADEGVEERAVQIVIVNGRLGTLDTELTDDDQVMLSPMVAGG